MKTRHSLTMAAGLALACSVPAMAQTYVAVPAGAPIVIEVRPSPSSAIHAGGMTWDDLVLANQAALALEDSRALSRPGITATVVGSNGGVTLTGTAESNEQAQRAMIVAKRAVRPAMVSGFIAATPG
jgi:osmotically-inducible protein OsmY